MKIFNLRRPPRVTDPLTHRNLAIYLLHSTGTAAERLFLTLDEALRAGCARLHETGRVGELEVENLVATELYAQAGDVMKGGWQDRALGVDYIVPPRTNRPRRMRVRTFCVERGRWSERPGAELPEQFESARHAASTREIKLSIRQKRSQVAVWSSIDRTQAKLCQSLGVDVRAASSPSSFALSVENEVVARRLAEYVRAFDNVLADQPETIGFAFAVNGKLNSADLYASPELFRKLWPKLLEAAALEALAESATLTATCATPPAPAVADWLENARRGRRTRHAVSPRVTLVVRENARQVSFQTMDADQRGLCVHQNVVAR
jgi:hypothetical protein